jgi:hypothetical protein
MTLRAQGFDSDGVIVYSVHGSASERAPGYGTCFNLGSTSSRAQSLRSPPSLFLFTRMLATRDGRPNHFGWIAPFLDTCVHCVVTVYHACLLLVSSPTQWHVSVLIPCCSQPHPGADTATRPAVALLASTLMPVPCGS